MNKICSLILFTKIIHKSNYDITFLLYFKWKGRNGVSMSETVKENSNFWVPRRRQKYENIMLLLTQFIDSIDDEICQKSGNHLVRYTEKRLKSEASIEDKYKRKYGNVDWNNIENKINDLAGVRVICFDTRQVYLLVKEIRKSKEFTVLKEKDYIENPKESGYQSYHVILDFGGSKIELQIRTILMDAWSSLDTVLVYKKKNKPSKEVVKKIIIDQIITPIQIIYNYFQFLSLFNCIAFARFNIFVPLTH